MDTVLCDRSALEYWGSPEMQALLPAQPARSVTALLPRTSAEAARAAQRAPDELARPLHLLAARSIRPPAGSELVVHAQSAPLSAHDLRRLSRGLVVTAPELSFLRARPPALVPLIELGCVLCGRFSLARDESLVERDPLTSPDLLAAALERAGHIRGAQLARRALPFVAANARSPLEIALYLLLCLPYRLGGYGLPAPALNARIPLGPHKQHLLGQRFFECDLLWEEQRIAVEYDSAAFHTGAERIARDAARKNALSSLGISVITVTTRQLFDYVAFDRAARIIAKALGKRIRPRDDRFIERQSALRGALLDRYRRG